MSSVETRRRETNKLLFTSKLSSCCMVGGAILCTISLLPQKRYGLFGDLFVIGIWVMNYFVINANLAATQRLLMIRRILEERDAEALSMFSTVSLRMHTIALLLWLNPYRLYRRQWDEPS